MYSQESRLIEYCLRSNKKNAKINIQDPTKAQSLIMTHDCENKGCLLSRDTPQKTLFNSYYYSHNHRDYGKVDLYPYSNLTQLRSMSHFDINPLKENSDNADKAQLDHFKEAKCTSSSIMEPNGPIEVAQENEAHQQEQREDNNKETIQLESAKKEHLESIIFSGRNSNSLDRISLLMKHNNNNSMSINSNEALGNSKLNYLFMKTFGSTRGSNAKSNTPLNTASTNTNNLKIITTEDNILSSIKLKAQPKGKMNWDDIKTIKLYSSPIHTAHNNLTGLSSQSQSNHLRRPVSSTKKGGNSFKADSFRRSLLNFKGIIYPRNPMEETILVIDSKIAFLK